MVVETATRGPDRFGTHRAVCREHEVPFVYVFEVEGFGHDRDSAIASASQLMAEKHGLPEECFLFLPAYEG